MPLYDQIYDYILGQIQDKTLKEGDMLPTEIELGKQFGVSRPTVRTAVLKLVAEGRLVRVKGRGTFVTEPKLEQESTQFIESYNEEMQQKGLVPRTVVLELRTAPADDRVAKRLGIEAGARVVILKRLRYVQAVDKEKPVVMTTVYVPYSIAPYLIDYNFETSSLYDVFGEHGLVVRSVVRELEVKALFGKTALLLETKQNAPAHYIASTGRDENGRVVEYSESFYPADRNKFIIRISR